MSGKELLPCPHCDGGARIKEYNSFAVAVCLKCGAMSKVCESIEEAIEEWNRRSYLLCDCCSRLFAIKLRAQRKKQGRSVDYMSKKLHMSKSTYYAFESGKMIPHDNDITLISNVLGIEPIKLTGRNIDESIQNYVRAYR